MIVIDLVVMVISALVDIVIGCVQQLIVDYCHGD